MKILKEHYDGGGDVWLSHKEVEPIPKICDRGFWEGLDTGLRRNILDGAEQLLGFEWPVLRASYYLEFDRTGDREIHSKPFFKRRNVLGSLFLAECVENRGRFIDDIIDGIWLICEESTWVVPAHLYLYGEHFVLPPSGIWGIDLFSAETASLLAHIFHVMGDKLDEVEPMVTRRLREELGRRIMKPFLARDDFWWMGFGEKKVNNWAVWCASNVLAVFGLACSDDEARKKAFNKAMRVTDNFVDVYHEDGGCDEGPSYWQHAPLDMVVCLDMFHKLSGGKVNLLPHPLVKKMGRYIVDARLTNEYYMNFADASARFTPSPLNVFYYGKLVGDRVMMSEGARLSQISGIPSPIYSKIFSANQIFAGLRVYNELLGYSDFAPADEDVFYKNLQVAIVRGVNSETAFAAKGGHNDESHNHNDVGSFVLYKGGVPIFIDAGVETYTRRTFSSERYDIWTMQSEYHNLPKICGVNQKNGQEYAASNVGFSKKGRVLEFSLDISGAYPEGAQKWQRTFCFDKDGEELSIKDEFETNEAGEIVFNFMTLHKPVLLDGGFIEVAGSVLSWEGALDAEFDEIVLEDKKLKKEWGRAIYRIRLCGEFDKSGSVLFKIV